MGTVLPAVAQEDQWAQLKAVCKALGAQGEVKVGSAPPMMGPATNKVLSANCESFAVTLGEHGSLSVGASPNAPFNHTKTPVGKKSQADEAACKFLSGYGDKLGLKLPLDELTETIERTDDNWTVTFVKYEGEIPSLPEATLEFDAEGALRNLRYEPPGKTPDLVPKVSAQEAQAALVKAADITWPVKRVTAGLAIGRWDGLDPVLAWNINLASAGKASAAGVVNAATGEVLSVSTSRTVAGSPMPGEGVPSSGVSLVLIAVVVLGVVVIVILLARALKRR